MQKSVSIRAVHGSSELRVQRHGLANLIEREIRSVRLAVDLKVREFPGKLSRGRQDPCDAGKRAEIRVGEFVSAGNGRDARIIKVPGTEVPASVDFTLRFGICQRSVEVEGLAHAGRS